MAVFLAAFLARIGHLMALRSTPWMDLTLGDASTYDAWARRIAGGDWMSGADVFYQAPLYPYFLAVVYKVAGSTPVVVRAIQAVIGAASCALLADAGRRLISPRAGLIAGVALALYPPAIFHDLLLQKSVLDLFFMCAALAAFARGRWFWLGLSVACLTLTRENAIVLLVPLGAWLLFGRADRSSTTRVRAALLLTTGLAIPIAPVAARNFAVSGEVHLTTSQFGPNLYIGNNAQADGTYRPLVARRARAVYERSDAVRLAEQATGRKLSPGEVSSYYVGLVRDYVRDRPGDWLRLEWRKFLLAWNVTEVADTEDQYAHADHSPALRWLGVIFNMGVLTPLAVAGMWILWPMRGRLWPLHAMVAVYLATLLVFYVFARYRLPMVPLLAIFAAAALTERNWGRVGFLRIWTKSYPTPISFGCAASVALAAVVANWPIVKADTMRAVTYFNTGVALQRLGRSDDAIANFETAIRLHPGFAEAHNNLGRVQASLERFEDAARSYEQALASDPGFAPARQNLAEALNSRGIELARSGRIDEAASFYERALEADPNHAGAHNNVGLAMAMRDRIDEAIPHFERAIAIGPSTARMHINLGMAYARRGEMARAAEQFQRALTLEPDNAEARANLERARR